jgi:hypothetical protein
VRRAQEFQQAFRLKPRALIEFVDGSHQSASACDVVVASRFFRHRTRV